MTRMSKMQPKSGAVGFLLKQTSAHDVCRAIREVHAGKNIFQPLNLQTSRSSQSAIAQTARERSKRKSPN